MRRTAILVIAALNQPVYRHYIATYWTEMIRYTNAMTPDVDVFLLIQHDTPIEPFTHLGDNVIVDAETDLDRLMNPHHRRPGVPGITSKTIHALDVLAGEYDVFFRTNLSSLIRVGAFAEFVQSADDICYSGAWTWDDALRSDLVAQGWVGPGRIVEDLDELDDYPGNTFISGSGFFLSADEAASLVARREEVRYDITDDVTIGLMFDHYRGLPGLSTVVEPRLTVDEKMDRIRSASGFHIRLQHFPVEKAEELWRALEVEPLWQ